ncbi:ABC transporter ATP-binding protein [Desulfitobacterium sp.]|uniref:ABC transporter ATP-binding protein n=1 Tax=Desulfitobacterium sp. TaxID=49981 RepID=UPI002C009AE5|nr:ABC transporter ATP-binding protein [Desulfitobacterium sp.]HVJ49048.1 ABC transporter ATP-binding protein [Desulfitobacterium sp.]
MSLRVEKVSKDFSTQHKSTHALEEVELQVEKGEFVCLLGPSGCGKSTLLNIIAGLDRATEGEVHLNGREITGPGPDRVVMFQESALFPWLRVIDNVEFGMKLAGIPKVERRKKALEYLKMVRLTQFKNSFIHELSGGMKQRVALARALALDSEILLMDEPFAALDSQTKRILQNELQRIWAETHKTIIFVTHSVEEAVLLGDRIVVMAANPGRVKAEFRLDLQRPRNLEDAQLRAIIAEIMKDLKEEVEKVAQEEYDLDWSTGKDHVLSAGDPTVGVRL